MLNRIIVISGPTGVGKTDFSLKLAAKVNGEIINIDSGQLYKPLTIGTAKPDFKNINIPHHLFDILQTPEDFTATNFRTLALQKAEEIEAQGRVPIFVGGSNFYIESLFFPPKEKTETEIVSSPIKNFEGKDLWQELNMVDPDRASQLHPNDIYRLERALTIFYSTDQKPSMLKPTYADICKKLDFVIIGRDRAELYSRINKRVLVMLNSGWVDEVKNLDVNWKTFIKNKKIIGYNLILDYLESSSENMTELVNDIQQKTRNYAKNQISFLGRLEKKLKEFENNLSINIFRLSLSEKNADLEEDKLIEKMSS